MARKSDTTDVGPAQIDEREWIARIGRLLAILVTKGETQSEQIVALNRVGFGNQELADLLGTTPGSVGQSLYEARKSPRKRAAKKKTKR